MDAVLRERLEEIERVHAEGVAQLSDPAVLGNQELYREVARRHAELRPVVEAFHAHQAATQEKAEAEQMVQAESDGEMSEYLNGVIEAKTVELEKLDTELRRLLIPTDPNDSRDVIMELRAATGGDEAALWAGDLYRMYQRYAEGKGWTVEAINTSLADGGGIKEATFAVKGDGAYSRLKYEAGPHRVQRVPETESAGRIHTSIATVAVLPEVEAVDVDVHENDLEIDVFRSSGPGGQSVNTTDSAVRITHKPTGLVVICQDEKSQLQNKAKALRVLRARLYQQQLDEQLGELAESRRSQVGTGERSEKIRTYNFKENRVTDHRVGLTIKRLPEILEGDLDGFHDALMEDEETKRLSEGVTSS
ncbi:MAG: peptide chain release factor 1 [Acidimicrobiia bacterium]|nr:peptide chain release factor 1 [Acidimicrobiia bacterium]MDH3469889.1 peptide chain release factor 1 [Acidimicrobiia bacterium]